MKRSAASAHLLPAVTGPGEVATHSFSIHFVRSELRGLNAESGQRELVLQRAGIAPDMLDDGNARVTADQYRRVCLAVRELLQDELAGRGREKLMPGYFSTLCKFAIHGDTLLQCLQRIARFSNLFHAATGIRLSIESGPQSVCYILTPDVASDESAFIVERNFINIYKLLTWMAGQHLQLQSASFTVGPPPYTEDYRQLFYCDLQFFQSRNCLAFSAGDLWAAPVHHERDLREMLIDAPQSFWVHSPFMRCHSALVRKVLLESLEGDAMDLETVAAKLKISPITLRRRLRKENSSYQEIKDHIRRDKAIALMHDTSKTISDIAFKLGYSDPSAFYRAFRQWVGSTPSQYRASVTR